MITRVMMIIIASFLFGMSAYSQSITAPNVSRCGEGVVTLTVTGSSGCSGGAFYWYDQPFYGESIGTGSSYTTPTPGLQESKTFYVDYVVSGVGICSRQPVRATISTNAMQAIIYYSSSTFCKSLSEWQPITLTGTAGGTFTLDPSSGLSFNNTPGSADRGSILPSGSTSGTYTITYTAPPTEGCDESPAVTTVSIETAPAAPGISYTDNGGSPYCSLHANLSVVRTGTAGGSYSAMPSGLSIDPSTGLINCSTSETGDYTVTYSIAGGGGCAPQSATATLTILKLPTSAISYASQSHSYFTKNQGVQSVSLTGTGVYNTGGTFSYKNSSNAQAGLTFDANGTITPSTSTADTYTVSYTLAAVSPCGVPAVATTTVTIYPLPTATIGGTTSVCRNSSPAPNITFTGSGGTEPYTFTYRIGAEGSDQTIATTEGSSSVTVSQPTLVNGTYLYTLTSVSDSHGSIQSVSEQTVTITVSAIPLATFTYAGSPYCSSGTNPAPTMLENGVKGIFSVPEADVAKLIFASSSTGEIDLDESIAGTYTVTNTIAAAGGCGVITATASVTITKLPDASFSYVGSPYCSNAGNQTATLASGAVAGVFTSTPGLVFLNTATGQVDLANSIAGTYEVTNTVAEANGCGEVHAHSTIQIDNATTVEATYFDYGTIFTRCQAAGTVTFNASAVNATSIVYTLDETTTAGGNTINPATGAVTFAAGWVGTGSVVTATSTAHCGNTTQEHITINTNAVVTVGPTTFTLGATSMRCQGAGNVTYAATATNSTSITWDLDAASVAAGNSISQFTGEVTYVAGWFGTSIIHASATANCAVATEASHTVTTYPTTVAGTISGSTTVCTGENSTGLTLNGKTGDVLKWQYSSSATFASDINNVTNTTTSLTAAGLMATTYYRAQVQSGVCTADYSDIATVTVVADPTLSAAALTNATVCAGTNTTNASSTLTAGTAMSYQWQYSADNTNWSSVAAATPAGATYTNATTETMTIAGITAAGTYYYRLSVTSAGSGCTTPVYSASTTLTVVADPSLSAAVLTNATVCVEGSTNASSTLTAGTAMSYQWQYSANNTDWSSVADATPAGATYTNATTATMTIAGITATGTYYYRLSATSAGSGCTTPVYSASTTLTVVADPSLSAASLTNAAVCAGTNTTNASSTLTAGTAMSYQWQYSTDNTNWNSVAAATPAGATYTNATTETMTIAGITAAGTYYYHLSVTSAGSGCTTPVYSASTTLTVNPLPTITTGGTAATVTTSASAQNTTLAYTATANTPVSYSINWSDLTDQATTTIAFQSGAGSVTGIVIPANTAVGVYTGTMTITTANGCTATQSISVSVAPAAPTGTASQTFCSGS